MTRFQALQLLYDIMRNLLTEGQLNTQLDGQDKTLRQLYPEVRQILLDKVLE